MRLSPGRRLLLLNPTVRFAFTARSRFNVHGADVVSRPGWSVTMRPTIDSRFYSHIYSSSAIQAVRIEGPNLQCKLRLAASAKESRVVMQRRITVYPEGFSAIVLSVTLSGDWPVRTLNTLINDVFLGRVTISSNSGEQTVAEIALAFLAEAVALQQAVPARTADILVESFSAIEPAAIVPHVRLPPTKLSRRLESDFYEAAIRRVTNFEEVDTRIARGHQKNLSVYVGDYVFLNYHNLFAYVSPGREHLPTQFYLEATELRKVFAAFLYAFDSETLTELSALSKVPSIMSRLKASSDSVDQRRLEMSRILDGLRVLSSVASVRARWFDEAAVQTFGIRDLEAVVERKLEAMGLLLQTRYNMLLQKALQSVVIAVAVLSLLVACIGTAAAMGAFSTMREQPSAPVSSPTSTETPARAPTTGLPTASITPSLETP